MCGVVAVVEDVWSKTGPRAVINGNADEDMLLPSVLKSATEILRHRGPDGMQIHTTGPESSSGTAWGMGHTRLAIVDPSNRKADMPFRLTFDDRVIHLAANGEIYNHMSLYDSMAKNAWNHPRVSGSDCEVIAHAYARYGGPEAVTKLDGMFAFVVFEEGPDGTIQQAFAARDPVGIKPLYYGRSVGSGAYVFASELKALAGHVEPASVVAVPPGHYWTPDTGLVCYYNPDWLRKEDYAPWKDENHRVESDEIRQAFTKAVQKRMMADVEYGFFLSGGIDSCVVSQYELVAFYE
jgi:asparagine synthase (glutamine-hydrolysing)